jgi:hypothetical protein
MSSVPLTTAQMSALGKQLVAASGKGDVAEVRRLAAAGADVNVNEGTPGWTPLASAAEAGHVEVVRELVARGARVDGAGFDQFTPLMWAARRGHVRVVDALVALRSRLDGVSKLGNTALHLAARYCHVDAVRSLVVARARQDVRNSAGKVAAEEVSKLLAALGGWWWRACAWMEGGSCTFGGVHVAMGGWSRASASPCACVVSVVCAGVHGERRRQGWGGGDPCAGAAAADGGADVGAGQAAGGSVPQG